MTGDEELDALLSRAERAVAHMGPSTVPDGLADLAANAALAQPLQTSLARELVAIALPVAAAALLAVGAAVLAPAHNAGSGDPLIAATAIPASMRDPAPALLGEGR